MSLKIMVDARWMSGRLRGMGRYALQLTSPVNFRCVYATSAACSDSLPGQDMRVGSSFYPLWEQKTLPLACSSSGAGWLLCPYNTAPLKNTSARLILVVHDLIFMEPWYRLPPSISFYQNLGRLYRRFVVPRVIKRAQRLVTVSEYTKQLMVNRYNIAPERITVIPNSLDSSWFHLKPRPLNERQEYILTVAGEAPSKNVKRMLRAYSRYAKSVSAPCSLKVVGVSSVAHTVFLKKCVKLGVQDLVEFEGYVDDIQLKELYAGARAFIFPSLYEGFGIPLLEAMASGVPIICSNTTSLPEVVGKAALQFDPRNEIQMASCIQELVGSVELSEKLIALGLKQVSRFKQEDVNIMFEQFWSSLGIDMVDSRVSIK